MPNKYPIHANDDDRRCAAALIQAILDSDPEAKVSVSCGEEENEITRSRNKLDILKAMGASGEDWVSVYKAKSREPIPEKPGKVRVKYEEIGRFYLIYCNGSEGEPMILIADYWAIPYCDEVYNVVDAKMKPYSKY
jgi:hypothetical protein